MNNAPRVGKLEVFGALPFIHTEKAHCRLHPFRGAAIEIATDPLVDSPFLVLQSVNLLFEPGEFAMPILNLGNSDSVIIASLAKSPY